MSAMRTRFLVVGCAMLAAACLTSIARAQTSWWRTYGGTNEDYGNSVQQTSDGGYVIAGPTISFGAGNGDVYLIKTNASGDALWTRTYGGTNDDYSCSVQQTSDDGYIVAGYTMSFGAGGYDVYLIKTNASGDTLWTRTYGGADLDYGGKRDTSPISNPKRVKAWNCGQAPCFGKLRDIEAFQIADGRLQIDAAIGRE